MKYFTESYNNKKITYVKVEISGNVHNIGMIEKPYENIYVAVGLDDQILRDGNSPIFKEFDSAYAAIKKMWENEHK